MFHHTSHQLGLNHAFVGRPSRIEVMVSDGGEFRSIGGEDGLDGVLELATEENNVTGAE